MGKVSLPESQLGAELDGPQTPSLPPAESARPREELSPLLGRGGPGPKGSPTAREQRTREVQLPRHRTHHLEEPAGGVNGGW